jgi:hypothetical protein
MNTLKPVLIGAAAIALLATAPVHAQSAYDYGVDTSAVVGAHSGDWTLRQREDWLSRRIDMARDDRSISDEEHDRIRDQLNDIRDQENHMRDAHDGQLTDNETAALETNIDTMADRIHWLHEDRFQRPW